MKELIFGLGIIIFASVSCNSTPSKKMETTPVENFELERYLGTWYEIARFPHSFEKDLTGVTAAYSLRDDGKIQVVNSGYKKSLDGEFSTITGKAKVAGDITTGHLKVSFFWFFYADYKILELDTLNYTYALVGSSSDKYLWILSRTPMLPEETYQLLLKKAQSLGYDLNKLQRVEQKPVAQPVSGEDDF
jgi:apolipoprotein D and lipocalin family protein